MQPSVPSPLPDDLVLPSLELRQAVEVVCERDRTFKRVEVEAGALKVRQWPPGFASLVRIIVGQQLSSKAARAIFERLTQLIELTPNHWVNCSDLSLKQAGLSQAKIATCQRLAEAILTHQLSLEAM
ncbi:MAG: hypothetical protein SFY66_14320 [Oculatellaceae cyanobacterium bins.114]|nr:hypothetical protein [Oculatellaceae cyanobacterium bins.114]